MFDDVQSSSSCSIHDCKSVSNSRLESDNHWQKKGWKDAADIWDINILHTRIG